MTVYFDCNNNSFTPKPEEVIKWRISVYAFIISKDNKVLVLKTNINDFYGLPGGGVEPGEGIFLGLQRECLEEIGNKVDILDNNPLYISETNFYDNEEYYHSINMFYLANFSKDIKNLSINIGHEIVKYEWKKLSELNSSNMFNNIHPFIEFYKLKNNYV